MKISEVLQLVKDEYLYYPGNIEGCRFICNACWEAVDYRKVSYSDAENTVNYIHNKLEGCTTLIKYFSCYDGWYRGTEDLLYIQVRDKWIDEKIKELQSKGL